MKRERASEKKVRSRRELSAMMTLLGYPAKCLQPPSRSIDLVTRASSSCLPKRFINHGLL